MKKTQSVNCDIRVDALEFWKGEDFYLPGNRTYTLVIDYPFNKPGEFKIKTKKGMGLIGLCKHIAKSYAKQYKAAEKDDENGYWHGIEDLVIEGIRVNHQSKKIRLDETY